jgi:DNA-binding MurR/RpiR family transcriptional regulator
MSQANRKIAHYFQSAPRDALFDSLAVFSQKCGVSDATLVRFAYTLGYSGYSDLQRSLRDELVPLTFPATAASPKSAESAEAERNFLIGEADKAHRRMTDTYAELNRDLLDDVCRCLMEADSVLIVGYMNAFGVAAHMLHLMDTLRSNVFFARLLFETNEIHRHIHERATILFFSFEPHYKFTHQLIERAHEKGSDTILITDALLNPLAAHAKRVLCAKTYRDPQSGCMDVSAPIHLIYAMSRHMSAQYGDQIESYRKISLHRFEEFLD